MKEMMQMGPRDTASGMPPRRLPSSPPGFSPAWERYYEEANNLARRLLKAFALGLDLDENFFEPKLDRHISALRANNYPDQQGIEVPAGSIRCSAHTDYGTVTILKSGGPGLQVSKDKDCPTWHDVPFVEDGFVINLGDLMRRWTNDKWSSTLHRVINPPTDKVASWGRRLAIAFFHNLNKDAVVEAIPSCISEARPALYDPIIAGEFLMLKHLASNGKADPNAHLKQRARA
jgi:isopenicillin N synthase-like dioxygenase